MAHHVFLGDIPNDTPKDVQHNLSRPGIDVENDEMNRRPLPEHRRIPDNVQQNKDRPFLQGRPL
jgi:hypothetical protein